VTDRLEFWPDYSAPSPLWACGKPVDLQSLPLPEDLRDRLSSWNAAYEESKLPMDGGGDEEYLQGGRQLLKQVRESLGDTYEVIAHEDWWGEPGLPFDQPTQPK
jgi:hypothetical protein